MMINEGAEGRTKTGVYIILILALAAGVTAGSVYLADNWSGMSDGIKSFLGSFFSGFGEEKDNMAVFRASLGSNLITLAIIFVMGFIRFGFIGTGTVIVRRGFIMGFTSASFLKAYGARGILIMLSTMPTAIISVPAMLIFAGISVGFSVNKNKFEKKFIFSYIFLTIFFVSIFCASSFAEGFLTTTFMKWLSPKLY